MASKRCGPWVTLLVSIFSLVRSQGSSAQPTFVDADLTEDAPAGKTEQNVELSTLRLPKGFRIHVYARVPNARSMALAPDGTLFVGNRRGDKVYAVRDTNGDHRADEVVVLAEGLQMPNGVAFWKGDLYVAEVDRIWRFEDVLETEPSRLEKKLVSNMFPSDAAHGWKYIAFGPDGWLYVPVGAPCNVCEPPRAIFSTIQRMKPDGTELETVVSGVRNTVGFDWHPSTKELWFTDNGRDLLGDDIPPDELNRVTAKGQHFGYPYCHGGTLADPTFGKDKACEEFVAPARNLGPHVAALGLEFYRGDMFPEKYRGGAFIAEHGSWNRTKKIGYRVTFVSVSSSSAVERYETFAKGWLRGDEAWGRPVDVETMADGSLLISDDLGGAVYRVTYSR
ncbi:MAG: sorbosone dehydrogenase family protein [Myxococcales bacterium]|nr:sorbosone dehydrogenase family protein [Myxococcales bacterium]